MSEVTDEGLAREAKGSVAVVLKAAREGLGLSLDDIAQKTRIPLRFLHAIEAGRHTDLPSAMYAVGFVRTYAKSLGLDGHELGEQFRNEIGYDRSRPSVPEFLTEADPARVPPRWLVMGGVIAALLVALTYWVIRAQSVPSDEQIAQAVAGTDVPVAQQVPAAVAPAPVNGPVNISANGPVVLTAIENVWLRVYERSGATLLERELATGERWQLPTNAVDPLILTGAPQSLIIHVGADVMPPLGKGDKSINGVSLKPEALRALGQSLAPSPQNVGTAGATAASANMLSNARAKPGAPMRSTSSRRRGDQSDAATPSSTPDNAAATSAPVAVPAPAPVVNASNVAQ